MVAVTACWYDQSIQPSGSDGTFSIAHVPEGTYTLVAWHERLKLQRQVIRVQPGENALVEFVL